MARPVISKIIFSTRYLVLSTLYFAVPIIVTLIGGCGPATIHSTSSHSPGIALKQADSSALNDLIASHKGQVVLVDYWATWCGPCVANFSHTVELAKKYKAHGLATIAVSFDLLEAEPKVRDFLAKQGAEFDNLISLHNDIGQKAWEDFDIGPLPEYRLYDRQGKLKQKWESGGEQAELEKRIQELLAE